MWDLAGNVFEWTLSKWGGNWQELEYVYPYPSNGRLVKTLRAARMLAVMPWRLLVQSLSRGAVRARVAILPGPVQVTSAFRWSEFPRLHEMSR